MNSTQERSFVLPLLRAAIGTGLTAAALDVCVAALHWEKGEALRPFFAPGVLTLGALMAVGLIMGAVGIACAPFARTGRGGALAGSQVGALVLWAGLAWSIATRDWIDPMVLGVSALLAGALGAWVGLAVRLQPGRVADAWAGVSVVAVSVLLAVWFGLRSSAAAAPLLGAGGVFLGLLLVWRTVGRQPAIVRLASPLLALTGATFGWIELRSAEELQASEVARSEGVGENGDRIQRVILVVVDTLRRDALGCYSETAPKTPNVDRLAADGVLFERARAAAPWTLPSMASMLSGLGGDVHLTTQPGQRLPTAVPTLAEALRAANYRTAAIGENSILRTPSGLTRGFDEYDWFPRFLPEPPLGNWMRKRWFGSNSRHHLLADELTDRAIAWLDANDEQDSFLWLHYFDPHVPYAPPPAYMPADPPSARFEKGFFDLQEVRLGHVVPTPDEKRWIEACYDGEVRFFDTEFGRLLDHLEQRGWYDDTLIVFTSDHGEEFWEHGGFEHGHAVWEEVLGVPLIVKLPGAAMQKDVAVPVSVESVAPTIQELCGLGVDEFRTSPPLFSRTTFEPTATERALVSLGMLYYEERLALLEDGTKYVLFPYLEREELYELTSDPGELRDRSHERPEVLEHFRGLWSDRKERAAELRSHWGIEGAETVGLDAAASAELRALGYVR